MENSKIENVVNNKPAAPVRSKAQIKREIISKYDAQSRKMIRGQFKTFDLKGVKEIQLTWKIEKGNVHSKTVRNNDILSLPYGYVKYLNSHNSIKRESVGMKLMDEDGNIKPLRVEEDQQRYFFRVLDILSSKEMEELEPSLLVKADFAR